MAALAEGLREFLREATVLRKVRWTLRVLGGDPPRALDRLSQELNARLIVVGGPRPGITHRVEGLLGGSVGDWLARNQKCPVMVVPHGAGNAPDF